VEWVDMELHEEAIRELEKIGKRGASLVDCTSFVVMRRRGVEKVLAFDPDFSDQRFTIY
jgi:predicted nucleic acid-binding protein